MQVQMQVRVRVRVRVQAQVHSGADWSLGVCALAVD